MASGICDISIMNEICEMRPRFYLKHLQAIDPSFVTITKPLSSKIKETSSEGLTWKNKILFETDR